MILRTHCLAAALSALVLAGCTGEPAQPAADAAAVAPAPAAEADILTIDTHVDIPLDYMRCRSTWARWRRADWMRRSS